MLLPLNTVQTQMQARGSGFGVTLLSNFEHGFVGGLKNLYRAIGPTVVMVGARQGFKFGVGAASKQRLPERWPEVARDAVAGAFSATMSTSMLYPLDTWKTRWQLALPAPSFRQVYYGFVPAVSYSSTGMALWVVSRNALERNLPEPPGAARYWKHFLCGAIAGFTVLVPTFPFDTLKKRLQSGEDSRSPLKEMRSLLREGGLHRVYQGFWLKCLFVSLNGSLARAALRACPAISRASHYVPPPSLWPHCALSLHAHAGAVFNTVFVAVRRALAVREREKRHPK